VSIVLIGAFLFGLLEMVSAVMPDIASYAALLAVTGLCSLTTATTANAVMQTTVAPELRGRVTGAYVLVFMGGTPLGSVLVGWVTDSWGAPLALVLSGGVCVIATIGAGILAARSVGVSVQVNLHRGAQHHVSLVQHTG
jgi:MFS family permease